MRVCWLLLLFVVSGCAGVRGMRIGAGAPARSPGCYVRHAIIAPHEAEETHRQVGAICAANESYRQDVDLEACALGGDMVVQTGFCAIGAGRGMREGVQLAVYVAR